MTAPITAVSDPTAMRSLLRFQKLGALCRRAHTMIVCLRAVIQAVRADWIAISARGANTSVRVVQLQWACAGVALSAPRMMATPAMTSRTEVTGLNAIVDGHRRRERMMSSILVTVPNV